MTTTMTTDGRVVSYPFTTEDFRCSRCRRLVRQGAQVVDVEGDVYCDLDCARVTLAPRLDDEGPS